MLGFRVWGSSCMFSQASLVAFGNNCPACSLPHVSFHVVEQFIPGNWPTGPYLHRYNDSHAPQLAFPQVSDADLNSPP